VLLKKQLILQKTAMTYTEKRIVESYSGLFEGLSSTSKIGLIENLSQSLKSADIKKEKAFFKSFGAFASEKPAKEIAKEIRASRKFRRKEIQF
jgi:hypothetical protein